LPARRRRYTRFSEHYSANPHCLSAGDKVDEGYQGGGIENDESAGGIGNAGERSDLDARKRD
jgi:hypothetical protein